ncbi:MAG: fumarate hydratase [Candidatus Thermoplasmatota archaeon]|jgi:fumarate hydratase subunit alpha|nr:fumarate hydratase [Candidatus Thermoplasmatota archaeon]
MDTKHLEDGILQLILKAETEIPPDVITALKQAYAVETGAAKVQLEAMLANVEKAKNKRCPMCQDTGILTFFVNIGTRFPATGILKQVIEQAVARATLEIPLRPNTVDPMRSTNHGDNLGSYLPHILWDFEPGDSAHIITLPKGSGSENMSALQMLSPSVGLDGVKRFVVETVKKAGGRPCPPIVVGVGIGGSADLAMNLGKRALLRPVGTHHTEPLIAQLEKDLLEIINKTGIGPMGLGGKTTALDVHVEVAHRHPASLPVGVVIQCWADRRASLVIHPDGSWEVQ